MADKSPKPSQNTSAEPKERSKPVSKKDGSFTKIILRRLPPSMTESDLMEQIAPLPPYDYFSFVAADPSLAPWSFTRAYISFTSFDDVILFRDRFDGYVFVDNRGNEYPAMVEMAPCSKVPKKKTKRDVKCGSLEDDPEYKKFVEQLKNPEPVQLATLEQCLEEIDRKEKERKETKGYKMPTPLTEFIKQKREEKFRRQQEKKQQREEEKRKRLEREKQEEKRRQQREHERKEREAKKEAERSNLPPRFAAAKEESKEWDYEKRKDESGATKPKYSKKSSGWGREHKPYYDDDKYHEEKQYYGSGSKYYEKPAKKRQPAAEGQQQSSRFMDKENLAKMEKPRKSSLEYDENVGEGAAKEERSGSGWSRGEERRAKPERQHKKNDGEYGTDRQSKQRYKDRPSVPIYQPGRKKADDGAKPE